MLNFSCSDLKLDRFGSELSENGALFGVTEQELLGFQQHLYASITKALLPYSHHFYDDVYKNVGRISYIFQGKAYHFLVELCDADECGQIYDADNSFAFSLYWIDEHGECDEDRAYLRYTVAKSIFNT